MIKQFDVCLVEVVEVFVVEDGEERKKKGARAVKSGLK